MLNLMLNIDREYVIDYINSLNELSLEKKEILSKLVINCVEYHKKITREQYQNINELKELESFSDIN